jgi:hypothetical protein
MPVDEVETSASSGMSSTRLDRRAFLRRAAAGIGASAVMSIPAVRSAEAAILRKTRTAYRLSSHGRRACSACKAHDAHRFYRSADAANNDRAHLGCNCGIVTQDLPNATWRCYFRGGKVAVFDDRWRVPKCPKT